MFKKEDVFIRVVVQNDSIIKKVGGGSKSSHSAEREAKLAQLSLFFLELGLYTSIAPHLIKALEL